MTKERDALETIWKFLVKDMETLVATEYAEAIKKVADVLGKNVVIDIRMPSFSGLPAMAWVEQVVEEPKGV